MMIFIIISREITINDKILQLRRLSKYSSLNSKYFWKKKSLGY